LTRVTAYVVSVLTVCRLLSVRRDTASGSAENITPKTKQTKQPAVAEKMIATIKTRSMIIILKY